MIERNTQEIHDDAQCAWKHAKFVYEKRDMLNILTYTITCCA